MLPCPSSGPLLTKAAAGIGVCSDMAEYLKLILYYNIWLMYARKLVLGIGFNFQNWLSETNPIRFSSYNRFHGVRIAEYEYITVNHWKYICPDIDAICLQFSIHYSVWKLQYFTPVAWHKDCGICYIPLAAVPSVATVPSSVLEITMLEVRLRMCGGLVFRCRTSMVFCSLFISLY